MSKKTQSRPDGLAYSTNKEFFEDFEPAPAQETLPKQSQKLRVKLDSKQRAGKIVTLIEGFIGTEEDADSLAKQLKTKCGAGGSAKDNVILIQGDYKDKVITWLREWGYTLTK